MTREQQTISEMTRQVDNLEDFIKICAVDYKISEREANEILRLIQDIKEVSIR